jgi:hypothetical protein
MDATEIRHYLEQGMLTTSGGVIIDSIRTDKHPGYYWVHFVGTPKDAESLISTDHFRIHMRAAIVNIEGALTALFPFLVESYTNPNLCQSVGYDGHSAANVSYWTAAKKNYKPLNNDEVQKFVRWAEQTYDYYLEILPRPMPRGLKMSAAHARRKQMRELNAAR